MGKFKLPRTKQCAKNKTKACGDCENYAEYDNGMKFCSVCGTPLDVDEAQRDAARNQDPNRNYNFRRE